MFRPAKHITLWLLFACMCTSCTGVHDLREARSTVAAADSLRAAGQAPYTLNRSNSSNLSNGSLPPDSTALAFAVTTLEPVRLLFPTDYAHANYYYGRLLRDAGNHPEAMLAFLRAVHSRTNDHVIKARSWSNMGTMCHLAGMYSLSYEMYGLSADQFLLGGDSSLFFYGLNNMAYELAEQSDKSGAYNLVSIIESQCFSKDILTKILETKAEACIKVNENDSALYYSSMLWQGGNHEPMGLLIRAQAYDNLGIRDSALSYANQVLQCSSFYGDRFNALYIILHNDSTINKAEVKRLNSVRTDIQMEHTEVLADLSQATLLLQQDLERKPDITWLWTLLITLFIIIVPTIVYIQKQKSKRQLLSQQISRQEQQSLELTKQIMRQEQQQQFISQQIINQKESTVDQFRQKVLSAPAPQDAIAWND